MKVGIDIVEIERLAKAIENGGDTFLHHVYTDDELSTAPTLPDRRMEYLAGRWAVKEALAKALGCGIGSQCGLKDICVSNDAAGAPRADLSGAAAATVAAMGFTSCQISISHEKHYAVAVAVLS